MVDKFHRVELLLGAEGLENIGGAKVILFGTGGVGSWCAECLIRSGIRHLTLVDFDCVAPSNINRQLPANTETIGKPKVEVLKEHFGRINPEAEIIAMQQRYCEDASSSICLDNYDYVIDAIDSVPDKAHLILNACESKATFYSSMGAALKLDPTRIKTAEFRKVEGDPLARALRQRFRNERFPARKFTCVYSDEPPIKNRVTGLPNGSLMQVTAAFGLALASLVITDCVKK